ncbi:MAG: MFS transporter [Deltaproteobacteria bacterium]|nr:MFS transporter [Deltaproteobacteria bacterium]
MYTTFFTRFYVFAFCSRCYLYLPIFVVWLLRQGLTQTDVMLLISLYIGSALLAELPTGLFADRFGRKWALFAGSGLQVLGALCLVPAHAFAWYALGECLLGVGYAFKTGATEALLYDHLKERNATADYQRRYANAKFFEFAAMSVGAVVGAPLYIAFPQGPFYGTAMLFLAAALTALTIPEPPSTTVALRLRTLLAGWREIRVGVPALRALIGYYGWFFSLVLIVTTTLSQPYLRTLGVPLSAFGWVFLGCNMLAMGGTLAANRWGSHLLGHHFFLQLGLGCIAICLGLAIGRTTGAIVILALIYAAWGLLLPTVSAAVNRLVASERRATVLSIQDFLQNGIFIPAALGVGWLVDHRGFPTTFFVLAVVSAAVLTVTVRWLKRS